MAQHFVLILLLMCFSFVIQQQRACHVTIQTRCLLPAARDGSTVWQLAYAGQGCEI